jgi:hypothetical protein
MTAGQSPTLALFNNQLTSFAIQLRHLCDQISDINLQIAKQGTAGLQAMGASPADAADIMNRWGQINTIASLYFGTATQASVFNFDDALSNVRGGATS